MYFNIIKKYINYLKKDDIINFAKKEGVNLNNIELDTIYSVIKTRWEEIYVNGIKVINEYKDKLNKITLFIIIYYFFYYIQIKLLIFYHLNFKFVWRITPIISFNPWSF